MMPIATSPRQRAGFWRATGPWLVLGAASYLMVNVTRVLLDPAGFASYFGVPLKDAGDDGWVYVYASRTALLAGVAVVLLLRRKLRTLAIYTAICAVGPATDVALTVQAGAPATVVLRHLGIGLFLLVVAGLLANQYRRTRTPDSEQYG